MRAIRRMIILPLVIAIFSCGCAVTQTNETLETQETAMGIQIETVKTDAFSMDYFRFGQGEEILVILPGLSVQSVMGSAQAVAEAYRPLTEDFTVYLFDRRKELPDEYSIRDMARDTQEALLALGIDGVSLFGVSQGGMIAMEIAIEKPELVHKLVIGSSAARVTQERYSAVENWIRLAESGNAQELYLAFGEAVYPQELFEQYRDVFIETAGTVTDEELKRFAVLARSMEDFDVTDELDKIACPVLAISSGDDKVLGEDAACEIAERLGGRADFEQFVYDGYGHAAYDTAPDYKERMLRFLVSAE